ncbi:MAG: PaaI family thioesterase [Deltaproteobacteria bacterium]|nr:MAG: PaaI family thioesterase [Deltaproteobacteria bacterium]
MAGLELNPEYTEAVARVVNESPYFALLSMEIKELRWGTCLMEVELGEKHLQPFGNVHGGAIASVVDAAAFWAVFPQVERGKGLTTVEMKLNYLSSVQKGKLVAKGRCIKLGRTLALGETSVMNGAGTLVAHGTATMMVVPDLRIPGYENLPPAR